jgi:hypothetical protein
MSCGRDNDDAVTAQVDEVGQNFLENQGQNTAHLLRARAEKIT